jgi:hypothetical protein
VIFSRPSSLDGLGFTAPALVLPPTLAVPLRAAACAVTARSLTFPAELVVGLIMRAKKLSSGGRTSLFACCPAAAFAVRVFGGGPKVAAAALRVGGAAVRDGRDVMETRELAMEMLDVRRLCVGMEWVLDGLRDEDVFVTGISCFAAEEAVCAVRWDGRVIGRVGDLGRGFMNPVADRTPYGTCCVVVEDEDAMLSLLGGLEELEVDDEPHGPRREDVVFVVDLRFDMLLWELRCVRNGVALGVGG